MTNDVKCKNLSNFKRHQWEGQDEWKAMLTYLGNVDHPIKG